MANRVAKDVAKGVTNGVEKKVAKRVAKRVAKGMVNYQLANLDQAKIRASADELLPFDERNGKKDILHGFKNADKTMR